MNTLSDVRIIIVGPGRHAKDTLAELLRDRYGWSFASSSHWVAENFGREYLEEEHGLRYDTMEECLADRVNHRNAWYQACRDYVKDDLSRLANDILAEYNIYVGMRGRDELMSVENTLDAVIWVEAPERVGVDPDVAQIDTDNLITKKDADLVINNDGSILDLIVQLPLIERIVKWS